jgi:DNA-binding transcriptional MocR family regulator
MVAEGSGRGRRAGSAWRDTKAGLHVVAWFPQHTPSQIDALVTACRARDVGVYSLGRHALKPLQTGALMLGYGRLDSAAIEQGVRELGAAFKSLRPRAVRRG